MARMRFAANFIYISEFDFEPKLSMVTQSKSASEMSN